MVVVVVFPVQGWPWKLVVRTFAYPSVHSRAGPPKIRGGEHDTDRVIFMTNRKMGGIPLGETWPMNMGGKVKSNP